MRIASFNCENLFNRATNLDHRNDQRKQLRISSTSGNKYGQYELSTIQRNNTAQVILDAQPDILAVQEIENWEILNEFNEVYLDRYFDHIILIEGNDKRGIDVGLLIKDTSKHKIISVNSHQTDTHSKQFLDSINPIHLQEMQEEMNMTKNPNAVFKRDCLDVVIEENGKNYNFLVSHFKSQRGNPEINNIIRNEEAKRIHEIAIKSKNRGMFPIILGDLNTDYRNNQSLSALINSTELTEVFSTFEEASKWTHYFEYGKSVSKLDYAFIDKNINSLTDRGIIRKGITTKCKQYIQERYYTIGQVGTSASDHCLIYFDL